MISCASWVFFLLLLKYTNVSLREDYFQLGNAGSWTISPDNCHPVTIASLSLVYFMCECIRLDHFLCSHAMHGQFGLLSPGGKRPRFLLLVVFFFLGGGGCVQCFRVVSIPSAVMPTLLRQMNMGSFTCAQNIWVRVAQTMGDSAQTSLHKS